MPRRTDRTYAEIDVRALTHNVEFFRKECNGKKIIAILKASCYGHGDRLARYLSDKIDCIGVATVEEGCRIRAFCKNIPILILGFVPRGSIIKAIKSDLTLAVFSERYARIVDEEGLKAGKAIPVHIKVDTGMGRIGFSPEDKEEFSSLIALPNLEIRGIFSHYASSKEENPLTFGIQTEKFISTVDFFEKRGVKFDFVHIANTAAAHLDSVGNAVRVGYGLYGYGRKGVLPVLSWKARVARVRIAMPSERIGYSGSYLVKEKMLVATISAGYGDGYPRSLSNAGKVLYNGRFLPITGRICMDMFMVDATGSSIKEGDEVVLIGKSGDSEINAENLGFGYEVLCRISQRVKRYYISSR